MADPCSVPGSLVRDAVAELGDDGTFLPRNPAMLERVGERRCTLDEFGLAPDQRLQLDAGKPVVAHDGGGWVEFLLREIGGNRWLVLRDVDSRERVQAVEHATARSRKMAAGVARIVHDLNNQFASMLALSADVAFDPATTAEQQEERAALERSAKSGARLLAVMGNMLGRTAPLRELVDVNELVRDAVSLVRKGFAIEERTIAIEAKTPGVHVRVDSVQAIEGIESGLSALAAAGARDVRVSLFLSESEATARPQVELRLDAGPCDADGEADLRRAVGLEDGAVALCAAKPIPYGRLVEAVLVQRRLGGDLAVCSLIDGLQLVYTWPIARQ